MSSNSTLPRGLVRLGQFAPAVCVIGVIGLLIGSTIVGAARVMDYYLYGWLCGMAITLGCYGLMLLQYVVKATWGWPVQRLLEAGARNLPLMGLLFIPIVIAASAGHIYPWANADLVAHDRILKHKSAFLNVPWFAIRALVYFTIWSVSAFYLSRLSRQQDRTGDRSLDSMRTNASAFLIVVYIVSTTFAYTDWIMSLDAHWFSTMFGLICVVGQSMAALALVVTIVTSNRREAPYADLVTDQHRRDWGNLFLMFVMLWAYLSFSQWLIIWSGNLPQEIDWFLQRLTGMWLAVGTFIVLFQFFAPFLLLLSGKTKRIATNLQKVAVWLLIMRATEIGWWVFPATHDVGKWHDPIHILTDYGVGICAMLAIVGLWLTVFARLWVRQASLIPAYAGAGAQEALHHAS